MFKLKTPLSPAVAWFIIIPPVRGETVGKTIGGG